MAWSSQFQMRKMTMMRCILGRNKASCFMRDWDEEDYITNGRLFGRWCRCLKKVSRPWSFVLLSSLQKTTDKSEIQLQYLFWHSIKHLKLQEVVYSNRGFIVFALRRLTLMKGHSACLAEMTHRQHSWCSKELHSRIWSRKPSP